MSISMNNLSSYISQLSKVSSTYGNTTLTQVMQNQSTTSEDQMRISPEGEMMSRMMRRDDDQAARQAHKVAFQETYESLDIESLDVEDMTDEEIQEVLAAFESAMADHMHEGFKPASDMTSQELKDTLGNLQGLFDQMSSGKGQYGPPPMGGPRGPKPGGQVESDTSVSSLLEALDSEEDDDSLIDTLLEAISASDKEYNMYTAQDMTEILEIIAQANSDK